jgi:hypothetical protein
MVALKTVPHSVEKALKPLQKVPNSLVWEVLDGQILYRRGYKDVMKKLKTIEEIMGTSSYQSIINSYFLSILFSQLDLRKYDILTSEIGVHFKKNDNTSNDIAIYNRLSANQISKKYTDYPAKLVIEIDIDIDPDSMSDFDYLNKKTQKMLDFGVEKVIWVLTNSKQVVVATPDTSWQTLNWSTDIDLFDGLTFNIQAYLVERGIL